MRTISLIFLSIITFLSSNAQEFEKQIATARSAFEAGNYEESRFAVQNALHEIDIQIGKEVLAVLPEKVNNMSYIKTSDQVTGSGASVGLYVERVWGNLSAENLNFSVISDSPLLKMVNTFLSLPMIMSSADSNQKKIKVEGYKAMLERNINEESGDVTGYSVMIPYSNSLLQLNYTGKISEEDFLAMIKQIPVAKVTEIAR
jgi:hypothetical protein